MEFYSPGRFFLYPQSPDHQEALQRIGTELQKTYKSCPEVVSYVPFLGEVCAVQYSQDMVSRGPLKQFYHMCISV